LYLLTANIPVNITEVTEASTFLKRLSNLTSIPWDYRPKEWSIQYKRLVSTQLNSSLLRKGSRMAKTYTVQGAAKKVNPCRIL